MFFRTRKQFLKITLAFTLLVFLISCYMAYYKHKENIKLYTEEIMDKILKIVDLLIQETKLNKKEIKDKDNELFKLLEAYKKDRRTTFEIYMQLYESTCYSRHFSNTQIKKIKTNIGYLQKNYKYKDNFKNLPENIFNFICNIHEYN